MDGNGAARAWPRSRPNDEAGWVSASVGGKYLSRLAPWAPGGPAGEALEMAPAALELGMTSKGLAPGPPATAWAVPASVPGHSARRSLARPEDVLQLYSQRFLRGLGLQDSLATPQATAADQAHPLRQRLGALQGPRGSKQPCSAQGLGKRCTGRGFQSGPGNPLPTEGQSAAQQLLQQLREEEAARHRADAATKRQQHLELGIGWRASHIPRNLTPARRLDCGFAAHGMVCVVLQEEMPASCTLRLAPTLEPAAAVRLEYLMLALQVRRSAGREPRFSLDPAPLPAEGLSDDPGKRRQVKCFEPAWLAGTSVGEVMFQADYLLKELSMGERPQPVLGMRSCYDLSLDGGLDKAWSGREWIVVRKADVQLSEDGVLVPSVKMGVEAREQRTMPDGTVCDARITRAEHPLVRYAEAFTHNFDLIAERTSAIFHLRELAKASVLAKFLIEADVQLDESWFGTAPEGGTETPEEIPQLWSERCHRTIRVKDGALVDSSEEGPSIIGIYGGVQLDLTYGMSGPDGMRLLQLVPQYGAAVAEPGAPGAPAAPSPLRELKARRKALQLARRGPRLLFTAKVPQGVDLSLDDFDFMDARHLPGHCVQPTSDCVPIGKAFWTAVDDPSRSALTGEARTLLSNIFNPKLCDRRMDGDAFTPPSTNASYLDKLRALLHGEEELRRQRRHRFMSTSFIMEDVGPLFPAAWTSTIQLAREELAGEVINESVCVGMLQLDAERSLSRQALTQAQVVFDRQTEDGIHFRIYRPGSMEVRTIQEFEEEEEIVAAFLLPGRGVAAGLAAGE